MEIHLEDCSDVWEKYIFAANESIVIFTPYFDRFIVNLLDECELAYSNITLVTQLDRIDSSIENQNRINLIKELRKKEVNVQILDRLHAKILIVDWDWAIFGSQNFTGYSTGSVEISTEADRFGDDCEELFEQFEGLVELSRTVSTQELNEAIGH